MDNDLISRQAAIDALCDNCDNAQAVCPHYPCKQYTAIDALPSAQPQIIHCAECTHWKHSAVRKSYCEVFDWMSKAEDFCSFAERREE
jgi:hypothetical protein